MRKPIILLLFIPFFLSTHTLLAEDIDPAYLSETKECQFTPELKELAKELEYDPVKIYNWVYENIEYEDWYFGSRKGAYGTYLTMRGNGWDQDSLLIALLRISNIPARYVYTLDYVSQNAYVEAHVSMNNYRGSGGSNEKTWVPLAPWHKNYRIEKGIDLFPDGTVPEELNFDFDEYLSKIQQKTALELFEEKIQNYLNAHYPGKTLKDIPYRRNIIKKPASIISASLKSFSSRCCFSASQLLRL